MANDFNGYFRNVTTKNLTVTKRATIGNQAIYANQGTAYFVDSGATGASDSRSGTSWATCCATLDGAINKCTANQGDVIFVAEGHTESYTTTGAKATFDVAGITVIGLGFGTDRPTFSFGHVNSTWTISAANVTLVNLVFLTAVDAVVTFGTISGTDCTMIACESRDTTDKEVTDAWTVATTANRLKVDSYKHVGYIGGDQNDSVFQLTGADDFIIQNCVFMTQSGTTAGSAVIELATECLRGLIDNCVFYVDGKSDYSDDIADTAGTSTVIVRNCYDLEAGGKFSGGGNGSSFSVAGDDVGTLATAVASLQTDLGDPSARTNLQTIEAMLGNPDTASQSLWDLLAGTGGIAAFPAAAAAANNVSLAEVIRYIQESCLTVPTQDLATDALTAQVVGKKSDTIAGTSIVSLVKIVTAAVAALQADIGDPTARTNLKTIEAMLGNPDVAAQSIWDALAGTGGIATFPAAAAPANDVSLAEVVRDLWDSLRNGTGGSEPGTNLSIIDELKRGMLHYNNPNYLAVTADLTSATWNTVATHELFTVTGLVRMRIYAEVTTTGDDTSGDTANIQLGVENTTDAFIAATEVDDLTAGEIWYDATPTTVTDDTTSVILDKVVNGEDVGYEITGEAATDGVIVFHCVWEPLNATGSVVAGDGSAMV
jgi:hypothetical protein